MKARINERENRVLILMPTGRDAELVRSTLLEVGVSAETYLSFDGLLASISEGPGAVLIAEEAVDASYLDQLVRALEVQPVWSDLPVLVFSKCCMQSTSACTLSRGNALYNEARYPPTSR